MFEADLMGIRLWELEQVIINREKGKLAVNDPRHRSTPHVYVPSRQPSNSTPTGSPALDAGYTWPKPRPVAA